MRGAVCAVAVCLQPKSLHSRGAPKLAQTTRPRHVVRIRRPGFGGWVFVRDRFTSSIAPGSGPVDRPGAQMLSILHLRTRSEREWKRLAESSRPRRREAVHCIGFSAGVRTGGTPCPGYSNPIGLHSIVKSFTGESNGVKGRFSSVH